jgi:hypothetical protein
MNRRLFLKSIIATVMATAVPCHLLPTPTITLIQVVRQSNGYYARAVANTLTETNAILNDLPWEKV